MTSTIKTNKLEAEVEKTNQIKQQIYLKKKRFLKIFLKTD